MADERTDQRGEPTSDDSRRVLGGFLSEITRRVRRTLLAVSTVAIASKAFDIHVRTFALFGTAIEITDERWLSMGLFFVVLYFWALFTVYALGDVHRSRPAIRRVTMVQSLLPGMALEYRDSRSAAALLAFRALLDVVVPVLYGVVGLAVLIEPMRPPPLDPSTILLP